MAMHDDLMAAATEETGLDGFGDDSFREGLEILLRSLRDEARLNATGEDFFHRRILRNLTQRLQVEEWYRRHPEIDDVPIVEPLFGLSLPRTGSTALSFMLAQDPKIRYLRMWESNEPCPPPTTVEGSDPRIEATRAAMGSGSRGLPSAVDGPMECLDLMALDFKTHLYQGLAQVPSYSAWLLDADLTTTYLYERRVLKLLQWGEKPKPWRLKAPTHLLFIDHLDRAFPDARFVMTHRDPTDVMLSVASLCADRAAPFTYDLDRRYIGEVNLAHWTVGMERTMRFRDREGGDRFYDIDFRAMQTEPIAQISDLYEWLDLPVTEPFEVRMREWWATNAANREPSRYDDPATFGLDLAEVRSTFADYVQRAEQWTARRGEDPRSTTTGGG